MLRVVHVWFDVSYAEVPSTVAKVLTLNGLVLLQLVRVHAEVDIVVQAQQPRSLWRRNRSRAVVDVVPQPAFVGCFRRAGETTERRVVEIIISFT